jgi:8-oxoguanine deaminase
VLHLFAPMVHSAPMATLLVRHAHVLATMDDDGTEIEDGGLYAVDGFIQQVGHTDELPDTADEVVDLRGHAVLPGLINTHHHFYQTLTRAVPAAQDVGLFDWLRTLYPIWARLTPDDVRISTRLALCELALSGCTTSSDHQYLFPNGSRLDDQIEGASPIGVRFHAARGSMSLGESDGGLPPDAVVERGDAILADTQRVIEAFHDPAPGAMTRIVVAPCSPFSVTTGIMKESAALARDYSVHLHTHVAETRDEERFCIETFGLRPVELMEELGWIGDDVWFAHGIFLDDDEITLLSRTGTGVAHCPSSNMRLASGIAPVRRYLASGVRLGLGVDGSASNDSSHMIAEVRQAMLLARLASSPALGSDGGTLLTAREALRLATRGSASVLGRSDIGSLERGKCADFIAISLDRIEYSGALEDPIAAVVLTTPVRVDHSYVHGRPVVSDGTVVGVDLDDLVQGHRAASARLLGSP